MSAFGTDRVGNALTVSEPSGSQPGPVPLDAPVGGRTGYMVAAVASRLVPIGALVLLAVVWEATTVILAVNPYTLPAPSAIAGTIWTTWDTIWPHLHTTLIETGGGFVLGTVVSLVIGLLVTFVPGIKAVVTPYMVIINAAPKIALGPILLIWFGFGITTNIIFTALICFFPVLVNFIAGLEDVRADETRIMRSYNASKWQIFTHVQLYRSAPYLFAGLRMAVVLAVIGATVAEFIQGSSGMGYYMVQMLNYAQTADAFAAVAILTLLSLGLFWFFDLLQAVLTPWDTQRRQV